MNAWYAVTDDNLITIFIILLIKACKKDEIILIKSTGSKVLFCPPGSVQFGLLSTCFS